MDKLETKAEIKVSVRNLVEFILRGGDIDNRRGSGKEMEAMQLGSKIHRKIQRRMGSDYQAEVPLKHAVEYEDYQILIEGRADGIIKKDENEVIIDEIKGMFQDISLFEEPVEIHLAQGKCYAYFYGKQNGLETISVQMTYCNLETEDIRRFVKDYKIFELEKWFEEILEEYRKWADFQYRWKRGRAESIKQIEFPFSYRKGQQELAHSVYRTILRKKRLFIQASTGAGKTMAALFPAVKAVGENLGDKIFYLTAKTITRTVAEEAFRILKKQGLKSKVITITAKEKVCPMEQTECNPSYCPYAKGHYDRVNDSVFDMIQNEHELDRDKLLEYAEKHQVCPYEMCLDASLFSDAVICDYNYVFDPTAHLKRYFSEGVKGDYIFLIDEAHNLVDRSREMYSAVLYKEDFLAIKKIAKKYSRKLERFLEKCNKDLLELKRECDTYELMESLPSFSMNLMRAFSELEVFLEEQECPEDDRKKVLDFYFDVSHFLNMYEHLDEDCVIYTEHEEDGRFKVKLFCVDPSRSLKEYLDKGNSTIFFSATLIPVHYYKEMLTGNEDDYAVYAESSFPPDNRLVVLGSDVSSKYTRRSANEYMRMAEYIHQMMSARRGNYLVFFPSYRMMEDVYEFFLETESAPVSRILIQRSGMDEQDREAFLQTFEENTGESLVGFCVMGGIFSEGIDLKRDSLIGVAVVGTGLPQVCNEREILKGFFDRRELNGFEYAYLYSGMNKVLQSSGRVIRTDKDRGVVLLMDDRFYMEQYKKLFPREWKQFRTCNVNSLGDQLSSFWEEKK